jgi:hypothetical protein
MGGKSLLIMAPIIWGLSCCVPSADGTLVIVGITAEATSVSDWGCGGLLESRINVGDTITGVYIYDLSTPDSDQWPHSGLYKHDAAPCGITLMVGGLVFMTDPENVDFTVTVENDHCTIAHCYDSLELESKNNLPLENGFDVGSISLELRDSSYSALSSDALPTTALVLEDWDYETGFIRIRGAPSREYGFGIQADLTSAVLIPEPATICVLVLGSLAMLRKRRG